MQDTNMTFKVSNENGDIIDCEILFTFENTKTQKNYIVYTDHTTDENGKLHVFAAVYNPEQSEGQLLPIETEEEWGIIQHLLDNAEKELLNGNQENA